MDYLTRIEAATILRVNKKTIDRLIARGKIKSAKIGQRRLIPREALTDFVNRQMEGGEIDAGNGDHC